MTDDRKKVILHCGFPKTGTTSIQAFLIEKKEELLSVGYTYPVISVDHARAKASQRRGRNHIPVQYSLMIRKPASLAYLSKSLPDDIAERIFDDFRHSEARHLIISTETFAPQADNIDFSRLRQLLDGFDVIFIAYIRRLDDWLEARYAQSIKAFNWRASDDDAGDADGFLERTESAFGIENGTTNRIHFLMRMKDFSFHKNLSLIARKMPEASWIVRSFEESIRKSDGLLADFLSSIGLQDNTELINAARTYPYFNTVSATQTKFITDVTKASGDNELFPILKRAVTMSNQAQSGKKSITVAKFKYFPSDVRGLFFERYSKDVDKINKLFGTNIGIPEKCADTHVFGILSVEQCEALRDQILPHMSENDTDVAKLNKAVQVLIQRAQKTQAKGEHG